MKKLTTPAKVCLQAIVLLLLATATLSATNDGRISVEDYIAQYKFVAIEEMRSAGIPASITLAQAILESRYGNSELARTANNHFGIKCHNWQGEKVYRDDDVANECFRKYRSSYESYLDHSRFLERPRYNELFTFATTDYKSWAQGLQKAGYATDQSYAKRLVDLIEKYELFRYDEPISEGTAVVAENKQSSPVQSTRQFQASVGTENVAQYSQPVSYQKPADKTNYSSSKRVKRTTPFYYNKIKTVVLEAPATAKQVAVIYNIDSHKVCRYNDVKPNEVIPANTKVYLQPKRNKGPNNRIMHTVKDGQTMERISQYYGIKLRKLYKRNMMAVGAQPAKGQVIYLRGKADYAPVLADNKNYVAPVNQTPTKNKIVIANNGSNGNQYKSYTSTTTKPEPQKQTVNNNQPSYDYYSTKPTADPSKNADTGYASYQKTVAKDEPTPNSVKKEDKVDVYYSSSTTPKQTATNNQTSAVKTYKQIKTTSPYSGSISTTTTSTNTNYYATSNNTYEPAKTNTYTTPVTTSPKKQKKQHVVVKGDTLYNISKRYNTTVDEIKALNSLGGNTIKLGQSLDVITNTK